MSFFNDKWLLTICEVRSRDHVVKAKNFLGILWNSSENWRKVYLKKKSLHSPGSSVFLLNIHEKCNQRAHEVGECKLKRLDDWSLCEVLPDVLNWKPPSSNFKLPCLPAFQSVARWTENTSLSYSMHLARHLIFMFQSYSSFSVQIVRR